MASFLTRQARLAISLHPTCEQFYARENLGIDSDISLPQAYLEVYARGHDVPFIDFLPIPHAPVLRTDERLFLTSDILLNNREHEILGKILVEWFRCCVRDRPRRETTDEPPSGS
jgi:hypothetical protein